MWVVVETTPVTSRVSLNVVAPPTFNVVVAFIWKDNKFLISKRKNFGLLGGLWEFPGGKVEDQESARRTQ